MASLQVLLRRCALVAAALVAVLAPLGALAADSYTLFAGGFFTSPASKLARWSPTAQAWSAVGTGVTAGDSVLALAYYNGDMYVGGTFTEFDHVPAVNIGRLQGVGGAFQALGAGAPGAYVLAFCVANGVLYVGGVFSSLAGTTASNVAMWRGGSGGVATALGTGVDGNVNALAVFSGKLYAGGSFTHAGSLTTTKLAAWDGAAWTALTTGTNGDVFALASFAGRLYVAGTFTTAGSSTSNGIACWTGAAWTSDCGDTTGSGSTNAFSLTLANNVLYAGGQFDKIGGTSVTRISWTNGATWKNIGAGLGDTVMAIDSVSNSLIYAGGYFTTSGGTTSNRIGGWSSSSSVFVQVGSAGVNDVVRTVLAACQPGYYGPSCAACAACASPRTCRDGRSGDGACVCAAVGTCGASCTPCPLAAAAGTQVSILGGGGGGGAGGWTNLGPALSTSSSDVVNVLLTTTDALYAFGSFDGSGTGAALSNAAQWDAASSAWVPLGGGLDGAVHAAVHVPALNTILVGGGFIHAGGAGLSSANLAAWNGTDWAQFYGIEPNDKVYAVAHSTYFPSNSIVYIGGLFTQVNGAPAARLIRLDLNNVGASWANIGGTLDGVVYSIVMSPFETGYTAVGTVLYIGGFFTTIGSSVAANNIARLDQTTNTFSAVGGGVDGAVYALGVLRSRVYAGGAFTNAGGSQRSPYLAYLTGATTWAALPLDQWPSAAVTRLGRWLSATASSSDPGAALLVGAANIGATVGGISITAGGPAMPVWTTQDRWAALPASPHMSAFAVYCAAGSGRYGASCEGTCSSLCQAGTCSDGLAGTGHCTCAGHFASPDCTSACESGYYLSADSKSCVACPACDIGTCVAQDTGASLCQCSNAATGALCDTCQSGWFGADCASQCTCNPAAICDDGRAGNGTCTCPAPSFTGDACDTCLPGYYGANCTACPYAAGALGCLHGACDEGIGGSGECVCTGVWAGPACDVCSVSAGYGVDCTPCPACANGGACNGTEAGDGTCACPEGYGGALCDQCLPGYFGSACTACAGLRGSPACMHGDCADGIGSSGACVCDGAWTGAACDTCSNTTAYGPDCLLCPVCARGTCDAGPDGDGQCRCDDGALADGLVGTCPCQPGYCGLHCTPCPFVIAPASSNPQTWLGVSDGGWATLTTKLVTGASRSYTTFLQTTYNLYIGGHFQYGQGYYEDCEVYLYSATYANCIGKGTDTVRTLLANGVDAGAVFYAGGSFSQMNYHAASNLVSFSDLSTYDGPVGGGLAGGTGIFALAKHEGVLIAGGNVDLGCVLSWNGTSYAPLGTGRGPCSSGSAGDVVRALATFDGLLFAAGTLDGGSSNVKAWDGSTAWSVLGGGLAGDGVNALAIYDGALIAGGAFSAVGDGGATLTNIATYNGTGWSALGAAGLDGTVHSLLVYDGRLYAAGAFSARVAVWDAASAAWSAFPSTPSLATAVTTLGVTCPTSSPEYYGTACAPCDCVMGTCSGGSSVTYFGCNCRAGAVGAKCDACASGFYGPACTQCPGCVQGTCNDTRAGSGVCECAHGAIGALCDDCPAGFYGATCLPCLCQNGGVCDDGMSGNGTCQCSGVWAGPTCEECVPWRYGSGCGGTCICVAGVCDAGVNGTGACACNPGFAGSSCDFCESGHYGGSCTACSSCSGHGVCQDGLGGNGSCACTAPWEGAECDTCPYDAGFYGPACDPCNCTSSDGSGHFLSGCNASTGACQCAVGWAGASGCAECAAGYFGSACTACSPLCDAHGACDDGLSGTGACACDAGWAGTVCNACAPGFFGAACQPCTVTCTANAVCSDGLAGNGSCVCAVGWTGANCTVAATTAPTTAPTTATPTATATGTVPASATGTPTGTTAPHGSGGVSVRRAALGPLLLAIVAAAVLLLL